MGIIVDQDWDLSKKGDGAVEAHGQQGGCCERTGETV